MQFQGVLGHEFVGEVMQAGDPGWVGMRVVADINAGCNQCNACAAGDSHHCASRTVLGIAGRNGCLAELVVMPERCLVPVPEDLDNDSAVFAEPLAAALHVLDAVPDSIREAVVLGDGKLGLLTALALLGAGKRVTLVGHHQRKLDIARNAGATVALSADGIGRKPLVVEATGSASGLQQALSLAAPRATVILKTTVAGNVTADLAPVVIDELHIIGSRCGDLRRAVQVLSRGDVDPRPLIDARYPLHQGLDALEHAGRKGVLKVLVEP
jgi:threonine dehydrogenase-like Zn-dependent dehydrogenase